MHPDMQTLKTKTNFKPPLNFSITETVKLQITETHPSLESLHKN